jgi:hypothetical protein
MPTPKTSALFYLINVLVFHSPVQNRALIIFYTLERSKAKLLDADGKTYSCKKLIFQKLRDSMDFYWEKVK